MKILFLFTILVLVSFQVHAQWTCNSAPTVNLTIGSGTLAHLPVMDQEGAGLCYTHTVSQLADAYRYARTSNRRGRISPTVLSMLIPSSPYGYNVNGGSPVEAVAALNRYSRYNLVCSDSYIRSILGNTNQQVNYLASIDEIFKQLDYSCRIDDQRLRRTAFERLEDTIAEAGSLRGAPVGGMQDFLHDMGSIVMRLNRVPSSEIPEHYNKVFQERLIFPLVSRMCQGRSINVPNLHLIGISRDGVLQASEGTGFRVIRKNAWPAEALRVAWTRLNQPNAQPLGISFCGRILKSNRTWIDPGPESRVECGRHAAVLAGTRCAGGRRQFLLRNSWGADCGGNEVVPRHRRNCDNRGNTWIDAEHLMLSSFDIYSFR